MMLGSKIAMIFRIKFRQANNEVSFHQFNNIKSDLRSFSLPFYLVLNSVPDPDPEAQKHVDPHVFGPPGSGSTSQMYGSGSFYHHAKLVRKTLIPTVLWLFLTFYL
jgi:hypothetical protein